MCQRILSSPTVAVSVLCWRARSEARDLGGIKSQHWAVMGLSSSASGCEAVCVVSMLFGSQWHLQGPQLSGHLPRPELSNHQAETSAQAGTHPTLKPCLLPLSPWQPFSAVSSAFFFPTSSACAPKSRQRRGCSREVFIRAGVATPRETAQESPQQPEPPTS